MKKFGIILLVVCLILLTIVIVFPSNSEWFLMAVLVMAIMTPVIIILATNQLKTKSNNTYKGRILLTLVSICSLVLFFLYKLNGLYQYDELFFYSTFILLLIGSGVIIYNLFSIKVSYQNSIDLILLIIPVAGIFVMEEIHFDNYIAKNEMESIEKLLYKVDITNGELIENLYGTSDFMSDAKYGELEYGKVIHLMDSLMEQIVIASGGYSLESLYEESFQLINANKTGYPDLVFQRTGLITQIRSTLKKLSENEESKYLKSQLNKIRTDLLGEDIFGKTVLEYRARNTFIINRLLVLNLLKRSKGN